jgi:hypothetical protein
MKSNQKSVMQQGGPVPVGSRGREPNWQMSLSDFINRETLS